MQFHQLTDLETLSRLFRCVRRLDKLSQRKLLPAEKLLLNESNVAASSFLCSFDFFEKNYCHETFDRFVLGFGDNKSREEWKAGRGRSQLLLSSKERPEEEDEEEENENDDCFSDER